MTIRAIVPALIAGTAISLLSPILQAADAPALAAAGDLPIKRITLYRSGVGSFERRASVDGDKHFALRFETGQINDILKTMVLLDPDGGKIGAVSYPSNDPLARRLSGFGVDISKSPAVDELFRQLRGEKIKITVGGNTAEGTILNVEQRPAYVPNAAGEQTTHLEWYVVLITPGGSGGAVKSFAIPQIGSFELSDPKLAEELGKALAAVAEQRAERSKTIELSFNGPAGKPRSVTVAYVHEMPVWKASYRLVLPDESAKDAEDAKDAKAAKGVLQGWAIVENTTDTDWDGVSLSLASGRPVSFTMDLYEPIYGSRPAVPVPVMGGIMPRNFEDAMRGRTMMGDIPALNAPAPAKMLANRVAAENRSQPASPDAELAVKGTMGGMANVDFDRDESVGRYLGSSITASAQASGVDAGEQFLYTVSAPVSIARQRSAMIPIIGADIDTKRVSIFNPGDNLKNPMRGVRLTNSTGLHLMPGPLAVFDSGTYAGDAQIPHTARNSQRLFAYALDLDVSARSEAKADSAVIKIVIADGLIRQSVVHTLERTYFFDNHDPQRGRTVLIEHARTPNYELSEPKKADETTESLYRFETPLAADKPAEFKVVEKSQSVENLGVVDMNLETLLVYAKNGKVSPAVVEAVKKAAAMQSEINATRNQIAQLQAETAEISQDQSRVRDNMGRIDHNSELYGRYMKKLNEQEDRLEKIKADLEKLRAQQAKQESTLRDYLTKLNVE